MARGLRSKCAPCAGTRTFSALVHTPKTHASIATLLAVRRVQRPKSLDPVGIAEQHCPTRCCCSHRSDARGKSEADDSRSEESGNPSRETLASGSVAKRSRSVAEGPAADPSGPRHDSQSYDPDEDAYQSGQLPSAMDGLNWWCYTVIGLLFITDFTPVGSLLLTGSNDAALWLSAVQWGVFVLPTLNFCRERRWDLVRVLQLRPCAPSWLLAGSILGPLLWVVTAAAVAARTGVDISQLTGTASADSPTAGLLFGELLRQPYDLGQWLRTLATSALSPAVAEELLYRGFLLTALRQRFGTVDAAALAAAMFAAAHLSIPQFFAFTLLGGACGGLTLASGSVLPAMASHAACSNVKLPGFPFA